MKHQFIFSLDDIWGAILEEAARKVEAAGLAYSILNCSLSFDDCDRLTGAIVTLDSDEDAKSEEAE